MTCVKVAVLTGRLSASGLTGEEGEGMELETRLGGDVVEEETEVGVGTTVSSSRLVTDTLIFGHTKVPLGLQILKPLFSLSIFAALFSAALLRTICVSADIVPLSLLTSPMFSVNVNDDVGPSNNAGGVNDSDIVGFSIPS